MNLFPEFVLLVVAMIIAIGILILPVKLAAAAMGAERTGGGWCLIALIGASIVESMGLAVPIYGSLVAFLLSAAVFAGILGTGYLRGIGIAVLHVVFSALIIFLLAALFGVSLSGLLLYA